MKTAIGVLLLFAVTQGAFAVERDCRSIEDASRRLACFDKKAPPKLETPAAAASDETRAAYKDPFAAEDARTTAKLRGICRGC